MPPKRRSRQTTAVKTTAVKTQDPQGSSAPRQQKRHWDASVPRILWFPILLAIGIYFTWYWVGRYRDLVYLTSYYEAPRLEFLTCPGGAVALLGDLPGLLAARTVPAVGATLVVFYVFLLLGAEYAVLRPVRQNNRLAPCSVLALIPVVLLTILFSRQGYYHFSVVRSSLYLGAFVALAAGLFLAAVVRKITNPNKRFLAALLGLFLFYPLFGGYTLIPTLYFAKAQLAKASLPPKPRYGQKQRFIQALLLLIFGGVVPLIWYPRVSGYFLPADLWIAGFPTYRFEITEPLNAFISTRLLIAALAAALLPICLRDKTAATEAEKENSAVPARGRTLGALLAVTATLAAIAAAELFSRTETNFLALVAAVRPLEYDRWEDILQIESRCEEPTLPLIELRRLALAETGQIAEHLFERPNSPSTSDELAWVQCLRLLGNDICYRSGSVNFAICYINDQLRLCAESPYLRWLLVQCSLANEEYTLAEKYLELLKPLGRSDWVRAGEDLLEASRRGTEPRTPNGKALAKRVETARRLRPSEYLLHGRYVDKNILFSATKQSFDEAPKKDQERFLCHYLLLGALDLFEKDFKTYYQCWIQPAAERVPTALQQGAAYIEYTQTNTDTSQRVYSYDPEVNTGLTEFIRLCGIIGQYEAETKARTQALASASPEQSGSFLAPLPNSASVQNTLPVNTPPVNTPSVSPQAAAAQIREKYTNTFWFYRMFASKYQEY